MTRRAVRTLAVGLVVAAAAWTWWEWARWVVNPWPVPRVNAQPVRTTGGGTGG